MRYSPFVLAIAFILSLAGTRAQAQTPDQTAPAAPADSASDAWRNMTFGATLEAYYQFNGNNPPDRISLLRAYDTRANTMAIQQATLVTELSPAVDEGRRFGLRADLMFGQATETVQGGPANEPRPDVYRHIWQAYGSYIFAVGQGLRTDFGKFASNLGYETNYAKDNDHFSRAYLFNFLPFYHSGLRTSLPVSDKVTLMYMLTNGIQQTEDFNDFKSNHFSAVIAPVANVSWTTSYYFGQEQSDGGEPGGPDGFFRVFDTYFAWTPIPRAAIGANFNHVTNEVNTDDETTALSGLGLYGRFKPSDPSTLAVRYERLDDEGLFGDIDQVLQEITFTAEWKFADGFLARLELRRDWSNERFFTGSAGGTDKRTSQPTAMLAVVWWMGNKTGTW